LRDQELRIEILVERLDPSRGAKAAKQRIAETSKLYADALELRLLNILVGAIFLAIYSTVFL
jgi:hypothetical protein